jgi:alkylated DNA repair dioxygenase AlkB
MKKDPHKNILLKVASDMFANWQIIMDDERGKILYLQEAFKHLNTAEVDRAIAWHQDIFKIYGRDVRLPRLTAWYGDPGADYRYSGIHNRAQPWTPMLSAIRDQIQTLTGHTFNAVLCNRYLDGSQHQGYHADDEPELGEAPIIASVSLGATRRFLVKAKKDHDRLAIELEHGSLLLMLPPLQTHFVHALAKTKKSVGLRVNLTYRWIVHPMIE